MNLMHPLARRTLVTLVALAITLGGCETQSTRLCPAFEGHLALADWAPYVEGDVLTYASDRGSTESYTLRSIERSEAYERTGFGDPDDVPCVPEASYLFEASGGDHFLQNKYTISDRVGVPLAEQPLFVTIAALGTPMSTPPSSARYRYLLTDPTDPAGNNSTERFEVSYSPVRMVGQTTYEGVFETTARETAIDRSTPPETTLTRVVFARNAGLVEFERSDGQTFTLVPP